jgi:hypothetical protein
MIQWLQIPGVVALVLIGCAGCTSPAIEYEEGTVPHITRAPATGVWELYPRHARKPVFDAILLKHDDVGFERDGQGKLVAVADGQRHPLAHGSYCWRFEGYGGKKSALPGDAKHDDHVDWRAMVIEAIGEALGDVASGAISKELDRSANWGNNQRERELQREERLDHSSGDHRHDGHGGTSDRSDDGQDGGPP